jgi:hypothetical protein
VIITKQAIPRRSLLRGIGATLALPLLDAMIPAFSTVRRMTAAAPPRFGAIYVPNGMAMNYWTPERMGSEFEITPILEPLRPFRDQLLVLSGLSSKEAFPRNEGEGDHSRAQATFLTGVRPKKTEGADIELGVSLDQLVAKQFGGQTQLASLELGLESVELAGSCDLGYSCAYTATISWRGASTPLPMEIEPRAVFERLFGSSDSTNPQARLSSIRRDRSILDSVLHDASQLQRGLGPRDRAKVDEYLEAVRDVERRIQIAEAQVGRDLPEMEKPTGIPDTFEAHGKVMFDLLALALQTDLTRVFTFMVGRELSARAYPEIGVPDAHHGLSHHQYDPDKLERLSKINAFHTRLFAYFLEKLRSTPDGDGTLLDHMNVLYGAGLSDSNVHLHQNQPVLLVGGGAGRTQGGRHVRFPKDTPLTNLQLSILDKMGLPVEHFGDSTGRVDLLSGV